MPNLSVRRCASPLPLLLALLVAPRVAAQAPPSSLAAGQELPADSIESIFQLRCAFCHGADSDEAPSRAALAARPPEAIVAALTSGVMRPMAARLTDAEIRALGRYLSDDAPAGADVLALDLAAFCDASTAAPLPPAIAEWNGWGRDAESSRFQPDPGFRLADVPRLRVRWAFALDGGIHSQPTVAGGRVYVTSVPGRLYSLDARTGCVHWTYQTAAGAGDYWGGAGSRSTVVVGAIPRPDGPARQTAFLGDDMGFVHAVDVASGEPVWRTRIDDHPVARLTGSPVLHDGILYVPVSSLEEGWAGSEEYGCCTFRGSLVALDAATGAVVWKTFTLPDVPRPYRLSSAGVQLFGPAGAPIWSTPTLDLERGVVYAVTGNSYSELPNPGANAILAFDLKTGAIRWRRQMRAADNFVTGCPENANCPENAGPDFDFGSSPILRSLPDGSSVLVVADKGGEVYGLDPDRDGHLLWSTKIGHGSSLGGVEWGFAADDEHVYLAVSDYVAPPELRRPGVTALRIADGRVVWHTPAPAPFCSWADGIRCSNAHSAAVSLVPGAVFAGALDGHIRAYSAADGSVLWDFDTARLFRTVNGQLAEGGSLDGGGPTIANGTLFLASGYTRFGRKPGNVLLAFTPGGR